MCEENISKYPKKITRTSTRFFKQIWQPNRKDTETVRVYRGYFQRCRQSYLNDFVSHRTLLSADLSSEKIVSVHENNAAMSNFNHITSTGTTHQFENNMQKNHPLSSRWNSSTETGVWTSHITDAFLDQFQIPSGQKRKRHETYKIKSELLFHCLSYKIGNSNLVNFRQNIRCGDYQNALYINSGRETQVIGSKAEGLDMKGSDIDLLGVYFYAQETNFKKEKSVETQNFEFIYSSLEDGIYPGYVLLRKKLNENFVWASCDFNKELQKTGSIIKSSIHGPALWHSIFDDECDNITAGKSPNWPEIANGWKTRRRKFGWPSEEMIINISRKGCHIVPVGSNRDPSKDIDWRLSFCVAERELVWTFTQPQILIYGLLKLILKEIINQNDNKK